MNKYIERLWHALASEDDRKAAEDELGKIRTLPVIWLLGKTGAGKSSLIRSLTGIDDAELGNGFAPCTRTAQNFDYPQDLPLMRFLDTRGLGEVDYDPEEDLQVCLEASHAVLAVARLNDPVQGEVRDALAAIVKKAPESRIIVVHNGADQVKDPQQRFRSRAQTQEVFEKAAHQKLPSVETALPPDQLQLESPGICDLIHLLDEIMPEVALLLAEEDLRDGERKKYAQVRSTIIWYASAAGTTDLAPVLGAVTVPSIQAAMLKVLGKNYGVDWTKSRISEFGLALGMGIAGRFGGSYLARQLGKLVPGYGQTVGAVAAGTISFATTFALGRTAAYYLHRIQHGKQINNKDIRALYKDALRRARHDRT